MKPLQRKLLAAVCGASLFAMGAAGVQAKTLVFCSEGSPEGFNPAFYTAGTTFDASSRAIFNRLVEFERGTTKIGPSPGREVGGVRRWSRVHLQSAQRG